MEIIKTVIVGQSEKCNIRITTDEYVSGQHCKLFQFSNGDVFVEDLGSTNGTQIIQGNGLGKLRVTSPMRIFPGDTLVVGRTHIPWSVNGN
jgi:pSer/pThr/pTyr-binding forkhead associated (FHA) protein